MSLQVWLPLNGNLNNQGLSEVTVINNGATVDSNGKIGSCYSIGSGKYISFSSYPWMTMKPQYNFSCLFWVKGTTDSWLLACGAWEFMFRPSFIQVHLAGDGRYPARYTANFDANTWYHLGFTWSGIEGKLRLYLDGNLVATSDVPSSANFDIYPSFTIPYIYDEPRYINDFRLYDHCLSAKEVKEISKGLVCHYKLDNNGFGNPNLFSNSHFDSRYTVSDWDTSKNGNLCANSWDGYNSGVGNPSTVYHAHLQEHEGEYVYNYHKTSNEEWLGISQYITGSVEVSKTYTFSCELKRISGKNYADGGLYTRANSSATSNTFVNWFSFSNFGSVTDNKWHRYSYTFTVDSSVYMTNGAYWYIYGHTGGDGEFLMRRPKLEEGSSTTEWIPHSSDNLYTSLGLDSTTEVDCSGYKNDGNRIGNVLPSEPKGRYSTSTYCNSTNIEIDTLEGAAFIKCNLVNPIINAATLTINWWGNIEKYSYNNSGVVSLSNDSSYPYDYTTSALAQYDSIFRFNLSDGRDSSISSLALIETGNWHMYTLVFNNGAVQGYRDGVSIVSSSKSGTLAQFAYVYMGINAAGAATRKTKSKWSDFRIYSTALSASDIKELYDTSASIDKNGNMYAYEFKEE